MTILNIVHQELISNLYPHRHIYDFDKMANDIAKKIQQHILEHLPKDKEIDHYDMIASIQAKQLWNECIKTTKDALCQ